MRVVRLTSCATYQGWYCTCYSAEVVSSFIQKVPGSILGLDTVCHDTFVTQGDQKVSVHLMITPLSQHTSFLPHYLAQSDCLAADRQGQGDTSLTLTPSVIPNSNYVIIVSDWNYLKYFCMFLCNVMTRCTDPFWSPCIFFSPSLQISGIIT
jgi:hypothetical protein